MPFHLHVIGVSDESVTVEWSRPYQTGGTPITGYIIEKRESTTTTWTRVTHVSAKTTSYKVTCLEAAYTYYIRIAAENDEGVGDYLELLDPVRPTKPRSKNINSLICI